MFELTVNSTPVVFNKFFSEGDRKDTLSALHRANARRVVFIDCPATSQLVTTIESLRVDGVEVVIRDHHDAPERRSDREAAINDAANRLRQILGEAAVISTRDAHPGCALLLKAGEFSREGDAIVADSDPDGLLGAMKAAGVVYPELEQDAIIFDGPRSAQVGLSSLGELLVKGLATLPPYNAKQPQVSEEAKGKLFAEFVAAVSGDAKAKASLEAKVEAFEKGVRLAQELASQAAKILPDVVLVDTTGAGRHDLGTLTRGLESVPDCRITVVRKDNGPIAAVHDGVQYSIAVVEKFQQEINLQDLLPGGFESSPAAGIISNTRFLLHVSERVWGEVILPALKARAS